MGKRSVEYCHKYKKFLFQKIFLNWVAVRFNKIIISLKKINRRNSAFFVKKYFLFLFLDSDIENNQPYPFIWDLPLGDKTQVIKVLWPYYSL